jgi:uncharacterized protein (TIGR03067 family)
MRTAVTLLLIVLPAIAAPVPKALKKPPQSPDGTWHLEEFHTDGQVGAVEQVTRDWVIAGEHIFAGRQTEPAHGDKGPPNFTVADESNPQRRKWGNCPAVFELDRDGDTLRCCYAHDGRKEMTECKPQPGVYYYVFKRVK